MAPPRWRIYFLCQGSFQFSLPCGAQVRRERERERRKRELGGRDSMSLRMRQNGNENAFERANKIVFAPLLSLAMVQVDFFVIVC
jgi:hypothetical protein